MMPYGQVVEGTLQSYSNLSHIPTTTIRNASSLVVSLPMVGIMKWALFWDNERDSVKY